MEFIILPFFSKIWITNVAATLALLKSRLFVAGFRREEHSATSPFYVDVSKEKMI